MKNTRKERRHRIKDIMGGKQVPKVVGAKFKKCHWLRHLGTKKRIGMELKMEIRYGVLWRHECVFFPGSQAIC